MSRHAGEILGYIIEEVLQPRRIWVGEVHHEDDDRMAWPAKDGRYTVVVTDVASFNRQWRVTVEGVPEGEVPLFDEHDHDHAYNYPAGDEYEVRDGLDQVVATIQTDPEPSLILTEDGDLVPVRPGDTTLARTRRRTIRALARARGWAP